MAEKIAFVKRVIKLKWSFVPFTRGFTLRDENQILASLKFRWIVRFNVSGCVDGSNFRVYESREPRYHLCVKGLDGAEICNISFIRSSPLEYTTSIKMADGRTHRMLSYGDNRFEHYNEDNEFVAITRFNGLFRGYTIDYFQPFSARSDFPLIATLDLISAIMIRYSYAMEGAMVGI